MEHQTLPCTASPLDFAVRFLRALALLSIGLAAMPAFAQQCSPASGGPPCEATGGVAGLGDPDGNDLTVGNPIHPVTGNKYQEEVDAPSLPGYLGLEIRRHFNSTYVAADSAWGRGWSVSYDTRLYRSGASLQIVQADGRRLIFSLPDAQVDDQAEAPFACASAAPGQGRLFAEADGYRWIWPQQRELHFNRDGYLIRIGPVGGSTVESLRVARDADGRIMKVIDPAGRTMHFDYDDNGRLARILHPLGEWRYQVDEGGRMRSVTAPDGAVRHYQYDDSGHSARFTAITLAAPGAPEQTVAQWRYDSQGRAVGFRRADGSELRMAYDQPPLQLPDAAPAAPAERVSVLTNALGGRTYFTAREVDGKWRVIEIRGPGCEECGTTNIRMRYDRDGQLSARWKIGGKGLAYERDRHGRIVRVMEIPAGLPLPLSRPRGAPAVTGPPAPRATSSLASSPTASPGSYRQRFEYPDDSNSLPRLIASPSVIPGKERRIHISRNSRGDALEVLQEGFSPDTTGVPGAAPVVVARRVTLLYRQVGDRQVLVRLDGPLPNGAAGNPSDSDVTDFAHDSSGLPSRITLPGGTLRSYVSRDPGGRPVVISTSDGYREVEERRVYNLRGDVVESRIRAWLLDSLRVRMPESVISNSTRRDFDIHGRLRQVSDTAGRVIHYDRDPVGRLRGIRDARGFRTALTRDAEGQVLVVALHQPGVHETHRATYFNRDRQGRLESMLLPDGRHFRIHYDLNGEAIGFSDVAGRLQLVALSGTLALTGGASVVGAAGMTGAGGAAGSVLADDFGQRLKQVLPDHGATTSRYDAAGRLIEVVDATGVSTKYRYDAADRLFARISGGGDERTDFRYEGSLLVGVVDPGQRVSYRLDALGRTVATETSFAGLRGAPLQTSTAYDPDTGLAIVYRLAGGQSLRVRRGPPEEGASPMQLDLLSTRWALAADWLQARFPDKMVQLVNDWLPHTTIVRQIRIHPFDGLAGFVHGNGMSMSRQVDLAGRMVRLRIAAAEAPVADWRFGYGVGARLLSISGQQPAAVPAGASSLVNRNFTYDGAGRLIAMQDQPGQGAVGGIPDSTRENARVDPASSMKILPDARRTNHSVSLDRAGRVIRDERFRYTYTPFGQVESVRDLNGGRLVAAYAYNHRFQRIRKTVYDGNGAGTVSFYLWNHNRLVAEVAADGEITAQYLGLDTGRASLPVAKLQPRSHRLGKGGQDVMAVHADHRGAPVAMSDERQRLTWQATVSPRGQAEFAQYPTGTRMNLRLPGQHWDAETGLHDNWHRTYDPRSGLYLQPDPLGYHSDSPDAYLYAGGDPLNRLDPTGLYQIDVHYYMTFFLGVTGGLDPQEARIVALAAQYVDDNPLTRPVDPTDLRSTVGSMFGNQRQLLNYHFVLSGANGQTLPAYRNSRLDNPDSPQLQNLFNAASSSGLGRNANLQLLGEYLHALADTYSHRDAGNLPYDALIANCGVGHGHALHEPDLTYDVLPAGPADEGRPLPGQVWLREPRTLAMELQLHGVLLTFGDPAKAKSAQDIEAVLRQFNGIRESEEGSDGFSRKIELLQSSLVALGFGLMDLVGEDEYGYSEREARSNRNAFLGGTQARVPLSEEDFPGTCLPGGIRCTSN